VQRLVRRRVTSCVQEENDAYDVILVDVDGTVAAVCVLAKVLDGETCDLVVVAIANGYQHVEFQSPPAGDSANRLNVVRAYRKLTKQRLAKNELGLDLERAETADANVQAW
jgi:hypothetical protein